MFQRSDLTDKFAELQIAWGTDGLGGDGKNGRLDGIGKRSLQVFFFQPEDGIRDHCVTGVQTCALPISLRCASLPPMPSGSSALSASPRTCCKVSSEHSLEPAPYRPCCSTATCGRGTSCGTMARGGSWTSKYSGSCRLRCTTLVTSFATAGPCGSPASRPRPPGWHGWPRTLGTRSYAAGPFSLKRATWDSKPHRRPEY